jgi:hypothetical protein
MYMRFRRHVSFIWHPLFPSAAIYESGCVSGIIASASDITVTLQTGEDTRVFRGELVSKDSNKLMGKVEDRDG